MVVMVYISGISGSKEVKKQQQRILMILESKGIGYEAIDITEPGKEDVKEFMQKNGVPKDGAKNPLPPQVFYNESYCGDYDEFELANETDVLQAFLKLSDSEISTKQIILSQPDSTNNTNGVSTSREMSVEPQAATAELPSSEPPEMETSGSNLKLDDTVPFDDVAQKEETKSVDKLQEQEEERRAEKDEDVEETGEEA